MSTPTVISHALHWVSLGPGDRLSIDIEHTEYGERLPHEWTAHQMATSSQAPIYFTPDFWAPEPSWTVSKDEAFRRKLSNLRQLHVPGNPTTSHSKGNNLRHSRSLYVRRVSNDSNLNVKYKVRSPITTSRPIYTINESEQTEAVPVKDEASLNEEDASSPDTIPGPTTPTHVSPLSNYSALSSSKSAPLSIISPLSRPSTILEAAPARDTSNELWEFEINPVSLDESHPASQTFN